MYIYLLHTPLGVLLLVVVFKNAKVFTVNLVGTMVDFFVRLRPIKPTPQRSDRPKKIRAQQRVGKRTREVSHS